MCVHFWQLIYVVYVCNRDIVYFDCLKWLDCFYYAFFFFLICVWAQDKVLYCSIVEVVVPDDVVDAWSYFVFSLDICFKQPYVVVIFVSQVKIGFSCEFFRVVECFIVF